MIAKSSLVRGMALVATLLAVALIMVFLAVMVNVGTSRLRRTNEELRTAQALAAADAGAAWVRALLAQHQDNLIAVYADLTAAHSSCLLTIDPQTTAQVLVSLQTSGSRTNIDHLDRHLQEHPQIAEAPLQVAATASVIVGTQTVATRTVTTLLRTFHNAKPYSEVVGVIDDGGPTSVYSPGDPGGQAGDVYATELRIQAYKEKGEATPAPDNHFKDESWGDSNPGASGWLP